MSAVLIIDAWSSHCGACGRSCNPDSETHDVILGYSKDNGTPGCGERFTSVRIVCAYYGSDGDEAIRLRMRPDLPFEAAS